MAVAERLTVIAPDERRFAQIDLFGFALTRTGLRPASEKKKPSELQWQQLGDYLSWMENASPWLIADWVAYGEEAFGEKASQAIDATGFQLDTIKQYEWVAKKVPPSRRDPALSFSHHREVADLPAPEQRAWLKTAKDDGLSVQALRRSIRAVKSPEASADLWLLVKCRSERDRTRLAARLEAEGREVKEP